MSRYINTSVSELSVRLDQTIGRLLPAVADLLARISHSEDPSSVFLNGASQSDSREM